LSSERMGPFGRPARGLRRAGPHPGAVGAGGGPLPGLLDGAGRPPRRSNDLHPGFVGDATRPDAHDRPVRHLVIRASGRQLAGRVQRIRTGRWRVIDARSGRCATTSLAPGARWVAWPRRPHRSLNVGMVATRRTPPQLSAGRLTPHASRLTPHASRLTPHASRLTPQRLTPHASRPRLTPHASRIASSAAEGRTSGAGHVQDRGRARIQPSPQALPAVSCSRVPFARTRLGSPSAASTTPPPTK